jgi:hypothetical protein
MSRVQVDSRADPPRPSANQAVVGAINKAFVSVAQPFGGLLKSITKIVERKRMSPRANHPWFAGAEAWG